MTRVSNQTKGPEMGRCPVCARMQQGRCAWQREVGGGLPRRGGLSSLHRALWPWQRPGPREVLGDDKRPSKWSDLYLKGATLAATWSTDFRQPALKHTGSKVTRERAGRERHHGLSLGPETSQIGRREIQQMRQMRQPLGSEENCLLELQRVGAVINDCDEITPTDQVRTLLESLHIIFFLGF